MATLADLDAMLANVVAGFEGYRAFAPSGWEPPAAAEHRERIRGRVTQPGAFARISADGRAHVATFPLPDEPGVVHLFHLFVHPDHWGTGLATRLLDLAVADARAQDAHAMRLFTPAAQARARAFYTREGWSLHVDEAFEPALGLPVVQLRRGL